MGLFSRKPKVNLDDVFKEKYKALNQTMMQAHQEMDDFIKESLLCQVVNMYDELLSYIDQGAHFDKEHFLALKKSSVDELEMIQKLNKD